MEELGRAAQTPLGLKEEKYRKKPVVISAAQWFKNGDHPLDYAAERTGFEHGEITTFSGEHARENDWEGGVVRRYRHPSVPGNKQCAHCFQTMHYHGWIDTLEGGHTVCPGDWVITGIKGERYACKPDIFQATYELVSSSPVRGGSPNPTIRGDNGND